MTKPAPTPISVYADLVIFDKHEHWLVSTTGILLITPLLKRMPLPITYQFWLNGMPFHRLSFLGRKPFLL
jgi:hypothetical protein